jgi:hypothetical protein
MNYAGRELNSPRWRDEMFANDKKHYGRDWQSDLLAAGYFPRLDNRGKLLI